MLPPLILARRDILDGTEEYGSHLFLYPRTALAIDQFSKSLEPYAIAAGIDPKHIHSEMGKHYRSLPTNSVRKGIKDIHMNAKPRLVISTLETLKRRMAHPIFVKRFLRRVQSVTVDEVHLVSGVQGAQIAMLLRRLRRICPSGSVWNGASATIAKPEEHLARLIGEDASRIRLVFPPDEDMSIDGVTHHVFIRPSGIISTAGALVNATSLMIHSRRGDLSDRPRNKNQRKNSPKSIAFADNLELLGRWNNDFQENERTDEFDNGRRGSLRTHPEGSDMSEWNRQQREIPYAARFQNPLARRIASRGGELPDGGGEALLPVLREWRVAEGEDTICQRCKSGERIPMGDADQDTMGELAKHVHRAPHIADDAFEPFMIDHDIFSSACEIGTMDMCPYLRAGACTWFSETPVEEAAVIGNSGGRRRWDFSGRATSRIQSSKSESNDEADDLSDAVFEASYEELYSVRGAVGNDFVNLVMASPSLEVGVDLPNLTESILHKAVRNIASYRQKVGRVGREPMSEALNVTLATDSPLDLHFYRQPRKLVDRGRLEPVPLKERNEAVARSTAYLAIWEWVCDKCVIPEDLMSFSGEVAVRVLQETAMRMDDYQSQVRSHVASVLNDDRYDSDTPWVEEARLQVMDEIRLLLRPVSGYVFEPELQGPNNCIAAMIHILGYGRTVSRARPTGDTSNVVRELDEAAGYVTKRRRDCGWMADAHLDVLDLVDGIIDTRAPVLDDVEAASDSLWVLAKDDSLSPEHRRSAKRLARAMDSLQEPLEDMSESGVELSSFRLIEQYQRLGAGDQSWKRFFLSDTIRNLEVFRNLRRDDWFVSPETLFIHPHSDTVKLVSYPSEGPRSIREDQSTVPIDEALHSYLPGMWTMRLPQSTFKVAARATEPVGDGTVLRANLEEMERMGMRVRTIEGSLPAPPGRPEGATIRVVTPQEITLLGRPNPRYTMAERHGSRILDGDEGDSRGTENRSIRIPRSFTDRWLHVELDEGKAVGPYMGLGEGETLVMTSEDGREESPLPLEELMHPFQNTAFETVEWHDDASVVEYVFGLNRTISSDQGYGAELIYSDGYGADVAFGQRIRTEGVGMRLHPDIVSQTVANAIEGIEAGDTEWAPTTLRALRAHLAVQARSTGGAISSFDIEDIISLILAHWMDEGGVFSPSSISQASACLLQDGERLAGYVTSRVDAKMGTPDEEDERLHDDEEERARRIARMMALFERSVPHLEEGPQAFLEFLPLWVHRTILMSFGVTAVTALQRMSGGANGEIGYGLTDESWGGSDTRVVIYDRAERGNGNSSVARTFMHIPNIIRSARGSRGRLLPTVDYMSTLEETLLPCAQHHSDLLGMEYCRTGGSDSDLHKAMSDLRSIGQEVYRVSGETWQNLGISGATEGWKLPLMHLIRRELADANGLAKDDLTRATKVCWNGCPECSDRIDVVQGGAAGLPYLDRALLDAWFRESREATEDYHQIAPDEMAAGDNPLQLGALHTLALRTQHQRLRSSLLPWIIGVDLPRGSLDEGPAILIRESDVVGLRGEEDGGGAIMGTPSTGVKRLLWFDLLMTGYLDLCGSIPEDRKEIDLVYYDARDVSFEDVGIAPRMLEASTEAARDEGLTGMESLSDVLVWLTRRGFRIRLCVDAGVIAADGNAPVRDFLRSLRSARTDGNLKILARRVIDSDGRPRNMHKKILATPIYALNGSANLTYSGTTGNEEIESHARFGNPNYNRVRTNCEDTLIESGPIDWDSLPED